MKIYKLVSMSILLLGMASIPIESYSNAPDKDLDNDGVWDYGKGGIDRDLDNDGVWDQD